jgi:hypothetical protein
MLKEIEVIKIQYKGMEYEPLLASVLDLKQGDKYLYNNGVNKEDWTKGSIETHHMGGVGIMLLEGRQKGKFWYIFPDRLLCKV